MFYTSETAPTNKELWRFGYKFTKNKKRVQINRKPERGIIKCPNFNRRIFQTLDVDGLYCVTGSEYLFSDTKEEAEVEYEKLKSGITTFDNFTNGKTYPLNQVLWVFSDRHPPVYGYFKKVKDSYVQYNPFTKQSEWKERTIIDFFKIIDSDTVKIYTVTELPIKSFDEYSLSYEDAVSRYNTIITSIKEHTDKICEKRMM